MKKARLLYRHRSLSAAGDPPEGAEMVARDLELDTLLRAMSGRDRFVRSVCRAVILRGARDRETILYRQAVLKDCLRNPDAVRAMYDVAVRMVRAGGQHPLGLVSLSAPTAVLTSSLKLLQQQLELLRRMHRLARQHLPGFRSRTWRDFLTMFVEQFDDRYLDGLSVHLDRLDPNRGYLISAELDPVDMSTDYVLRAPRRRGGGRLGRMARRLLYWLRGRGPTAFHLTVDAWDEASNSALDDIKRRAIGPVADALAQSAKRVLKVFEALRTEMAFYLGCLNLAERLSRIPEPISFPRVAEEGEDRHSFQGLYDPCLALVTGERTVGNDLDADGKRLVIITGANQGGKTTFLRSVGLAQLMLQCGMFIPAESGCSGLRGGPHTHFRREEDAEMQSGRLDEELRRMSEIVGRLRPGSLVLLNESFATTNEREGSEIARQVTAGLLDRGVRVFYVTHLYEFARNLYEQGCPEVLFLRAERKEDGRRTFCMVEAPPLRTSFGRDLYDRIFPSRT